MRTSLKGIALFIGSGLTLALIAEFSGGAPPKLLTWILLPTALFGFGVAVTGMFKHYKGMFGPIDPKREVDPGYDFDYLLCPHCKKTKIRVESSTVKCPICKKKTRI